MKLPPADEGMDVLSFVPAERVGGKTQAARSYLEPAINGRRLSLFVAAGDHIGTFGWLDRKHERSYARQLLLREPPSLPSGRVPLYICPECADLGCGAVAVRVRFEGDCVVWSELGWDDPNVDGEPTSDVRELWFDREAYRLALASFAA